MKRFIVYAGANGAGKSSLRADSVDPVDVEIDPDRIARQINPNAPRSVDFAAGKEALQLFDRTLAEGRSMSLETTLTGRTILGRMQAAKDAGYDVTLRYIALNDPETNVRRVERRTEQGGHWIEPATVLRRTASSLENLPAATAIADRSVLLDNSSVTHRRVLELERGRIVYQAPDPPAWLTGQMPRIMSELERVARESRVNSSLSPAPTGQTEAGNKPAPNATPAQQEPAAPRAQAEAWDRPPTPLTERHAAFREQTAAGRAEKTAAAQPTTPADTNDAAGPGTTRPGHRSSSDPSP